MQPASATKIPACKERLFEFTACTRAAAIKITRYWIERAYFAHVRERDDDLVVEWDTSTDQTGITALRNNTYPFVPAPLDDFTNLLRCSRF
jgi:hypothetical protein